MGNAVQIQQHLVQFHLDQQACRSGTPLEHIYSTAAWATAEDFAQANASWNEITSMDKPDEKQDPHCRLKTLPSNLLCEQQTQPAGDKNQANSLVKSFGEELFWKIFRKHVCTALPSRGCNYVHFFETGGLAISSPHGRVAAGSNLVQCLLAETTDTTYFINGVTDIVYALYRCHEFDPGDLKMIGCALCWSIEECLRLAGHAYTDELHMAWVRLYSCALRLAKLKLRNIPEDIKLEVALRNPHKKAQMVANGVSYSKIRALQRSSLKLMTNDEEEDKLGLDDAYVSETETVPESESISGGTSVLSSSIIAFIPSNGRHQL